jgi:hypothetical protein
MTSQRRPQREKPNQVKEQKVKSLKFFKATLATTLAIVLAWLLSVRPAQAGYTVTLQQVGPDVVATGSGAIDLTGLTFSGSTSLDPAIRPAIGHFGNRTLSAFINTGPTSSTVDFYVGASGPESFGTLVFTSASSGSGDMVGISVGGTNGNFLSVPRGYVSGNALSDSATYIGKTFATLGVTPGTFVWTWGPGANQNFTLDVVAAAVSGTPPGLLLNISTRGRVGTGDDVLIGGFIIGGSVPVQVVMRALGPSLAAFGITDALQDPTLELHDGSGTLLVSDDNWRDSQQAAIIQASGLAPTDDRESAIIATLAPGNYTLIVRSKNNTTGVALVEVYNH